MNQKEANKNLIHYEKLKLSITTGCGKTSQFIIKNPKKHYKAKKNVRLA